MKKAFILNVLCILTTVVAFSQDTPWKQGIITDEFIYDTASFPSCHSATIAETPDGIIAAWFGGLYERHKKVEIYVSRLVKGKWTPPVSVADGIQQDTVRFPTWNPVLYQIPGGDLILFYKVGPSPGGWWGMMKTSKDGGITWSEGKKLPDGGLGPVKNKPVLLSNGNLICPSSREGNGWRVHFEITPDFGKTWRTVGPINEGKTIDLIQPSVLDHGNGKLQILARSVNRALIESWSNDYGETWSPVAKTNLPNANSGTDAVTLKDGSFLLVYNHVLPPGDLKKGPRTPLNVAVSKDGITWQPVLILEDSPISQYSYPSVIQTSDGMVHIVYTWRRKRIKHVVVDPSKLKPGTFVNGQWPKPKTPPANYDEAKAGTYTLPDVLKKKNGKQVTGKADWEKNRRPEIRQLFEEQQFGRAPGKPADISFNVFDKGTPVLNGKAIRKQVTIYFTKDTGSNHKMDLVIYLPANTKKPVPVLLNIAFSTNANYLDDAGVRVGKAWSKEGKRVVPEPKPGSSKLDVQSFIANGFGIATFCYTDVEPDMLNVTELGIRKVYLERGKNEPAPNEWGAIAAWAWGLSRAMDYIETDKDIDAHRVAISGASRLGKTVLWAGANDTRFAMVIASISGEGGAAISRRNFGERVSDLVVSHRFPYQFAGNYRQYASDPNKLPVDAHMLLSLIAPRPLLLQTGSTDTWSDPKGEYLAAVAAMPVYKLFNKSGPSSNIPAAAGDTTLLLNDLGYFMHEGPHTVLPEDWLHFISFMKKHL